MKAASLNHVYRLVWSHVQNAWTVVAETARSKGKKSLSVSRGIQSQSLTFSARLSKSAKLGLRVSLGVAALTASGISYALPSDAKLDIGHATFDVSNNGTTLDINQTTSALKASWHSFNIGSNETVNLNQHAGDRAMFMITGPDASQIEGKFNVSNMLLFVNPNGIYFAKGSEVNVGNIILSTLKITDDDFLAGRYKFTGTDNMGSIVNHGVIKAKNEGYIVLLGKSVENTGTLVANNGSVVLGSAQEATLDFFGNGLVKAKLSGDALEANIKNSGAIYADGGFVQMATNARASAINISGIVEANQLVERDGVIRLEGGENAKVEVSGRLIAKGLNTTGGSIEVTGEQVALMNGAVLDASGDKGGGKVLVGGDYQGKNDAVYNARTTYVASGATIKADAIEEGNGGKVVVWADDLTRYYGDISAQGGASKGNGGFVEVSGKQHLAMLGDVNVGAANGIGGTVLFDPENIVLNNTAVSAPANQPNGTPDDAFANNPGATTEVNVTQVKGYSELYLQANNNITVNSALTMNRDGSVRLEANNDINVNAAITTTGKGSINLKADADNSGTGNLAIGANISGTGGVTLSAATLTHTAGDISAPGAGSSTGKAGNVTITVAGLADLGSANISAKGRENSFPPAGFNGGSVTINAGSLNMTGSIDTSGSSVVAPNGQVVALPGGNGGAVTISTSGNATVGNISTGAGGAGAGNNIAASNSGAVQISSTNGNLNIGNINTQGISNSNGANVTLNANNGSVTTGSINTNASNPGNNNGTNAGNIAVNAGTGINVGSINASGATGKGQSGNAGSVSLVSTTGDVVTKEISLKVGFALANGTIGQAPDLFIRAGRDVIQSGNIITNAQSLNTTIVAGRGYRNTSNFDISTGANGRWLIYSQSPDNGQRGTKILNGYDFKQYGTTYDGVKNGTQQINAAAKGNGLIYAENIVIDPKLSGSVSRVYDTTTDASIAGLSLVSEGRDGDVINYSNIVSATFDNKNVGDNKVVTTNPVSILSVTNTTSRNGVDVVRQVYGYTLTNNQTSASATGAIGQITPATLSTVAGITANDKVFDGNTLATLNTGAAIFNGRLGSDQLTVATADGQFIDSAVGTGKTVNISAITLGGVDADNYILADNTATTTASILAVPTTPTAPTTLLNISPRDNAGLGGLVGTNPALNTMTIVSLNPAAGDDEDPDAVACPVNEDHLGSTPILSSGVKLPDGVNSNCI
ncbi:beta strand repeat-containing protein [Methylophilus sp. 3sh_L]|uniref:beta strand repeat-containing protein n=1 Tax=Methylophilus sp. 3sh_L TaxID=3377114 RepID=UPI00398F3AF6